MARKRNRKPRQKTHENGLIPENSLPADQNDEVIISQMVDGMVFKFGLHTGPESKERSEGKENVINGYLQIMLSAAETLPDNAEKMVILAAAASLLGRKIDLAMPSGIPNTYSELSNQYWGRLFRLACKLNDAEMKLRSTKMLIVSDREKELLHSTLPTDTERESVRKKRLMIGLEEIAQTLLEEAESEPNMRWKSIFINRGLPSIEMAQDLAIQKDDCRRIRRTHALMIGELAKCLEFGEKEENIVWNEEALTYVYRDDGNEVNDEEECENE